MRNGGSWSTYFLNITIYSVSVLQPTAVQTKSLIEDEGHFKRPYILRLRLVEDVVVFLV